MRGLLFRYGLTVFFGTMISRAVGAGELGGLEETAQTAGVTGAPASIEAVIQSIVTYTLGFVGVIFLIIMIYNGLRWMTAGGNEEQVKQALAGLKASIIGLIIVVSAYAVTRFIGSMLTQ